MKRKDLLMISDPLQDLIDMQNCPGVFKPTPYQEKVRSINFLERQLNKLSKWAAFEVETFQGSDRYELKAYWADDGKPVNSETFYSFSRLYDALMERIFRLILIRAINKSFAIKNGAYYPNDFPEKQEQEVKNKHAYSNFMDFNKA